MRRPVRTILISLLCGLALAAALAPTAAAQLPFEVREQWSNKHLGARRTLDIQAFEPALSAWRTHRRDTVVPLVQRQPIATLQEHMAAGRITARDLVLYAVDRIDGYDGTLHAVLELDPGAIAAADALDAERKAGNLRSRLHGVPILVKDNIATAGPLHNTAGALALKDAVADRDSFVIARLRAAGALILGKANMSEWAFFMTAKGTSGFSALGGPTRNPLGKIEVCGSSSGSGAAVLADYVPLSLGTETAGSIMCPSATNAISGIKPTVGMVSRDRIIPITAYFDSAGPMARNAADLALALDVMAGEDPADPAGSVARVLDGVDLEAEAAKGIGGIRVGLVIPPNANGRLDVFQRKLKRAGAIVVRIPQDELALDKYPFKLIDPALLCPYEEEVNAYLQATNAPLKTMAAIVAFNRRNKQLAAPYGQNFLVGAVNDKTPAKACKQTALNVIRVSRARYDQVMKKHNVRLVASKGADLSFLASLAGYPEAVVPTPYQDFDWKPTVPLGMMIAGRRGDDVMVLRAAVAVDRVFEARRKPKLTP